MRLHVPTFPRLAVILSIAGLVAGFGVSWLMPPVYVSQAELQLSGGGPGRARVERLISMEQEILSRTSLSQIIQDPRLDLYPSARAHMPLEDVIEQMRTRDIKIHLMRTDDKASVAFFISFDYPDPYKARDTVQSLVTKMTSADESLDILDVPNLPTRSARPNRAIFAAFGFGAGFVLAVVIAIFRRPPPPVPFPAQTA